MSPSALSARSVVLNVEVQGPCWHVAFGICLLQSGDVSVNAALVLSS